MRIVGDTVFASGVAALAWFLIGLRAGWSYRRDDLLERAAAGARDRRAARPREEELVGV